MWYAPKLPILIGKMMENDFLHQFRDTLFSDKTQTEKKKRKHTVGGRNLAPPKGCLKPSKKWHVYHLSTGAGFRNHHTVVYIMLYCWMETHH